MKKVVVIGGGTGSFTVLRGLKKYDVDLSAVVSMADDGGSTGVLRDELGVLPPGDVRQCLVALSDSSRLMRSLMNYRFDNGGLCGHSFGNILLSGLEKVTGSFEKAVEEVGRILNIKGKVIPVTTHKVRLNMILESGKILSGERQVLETPEPLTNYQKVYLEPHPIANDRAVDEIMNADVIVFGPGGLYTSLIPNLLIEGVADALRKTEAKKIFVVNLMNKKRQTPGFTLQTHLSAIKKYVGDIFDYILVNGTSPSPELLAKYQQESELIVNDLTDGRIIVADLLDTAETKYSESDSIAHTRAFIRHDSKKLAKELMNIVDNI